MFIGIIEIYLVLQAFSVKSAVKMKRLQVRSAEQEQKRIHLPTIDRTYGEPPPFVVVVQGPPGVLCFRLMLFLIFFFFAEVLLVYCHNVLFL